MINEESQTLLSVLDRSIRLAGRSRRAVERDLGLSQGYLNSLFKGRIQLRVSHVHDIARALKVEPLSLFLEAFPPKDTNWLLDQLGITPGRKAPAGLALASPELHEIIRAVVRDEMSRITGPEDDAPKT
jgi:transcriptional regulator with XRE-family HTH domain